MADDDCGSISENSSTDRTMASANQTLSTSTASKTNVHTRTATKKKKVAPNLKFILLYFLKRSQTVQSAYGIKVRSPVRVTCIPAHDSSMLGKRPSLKKGWTF